MRRRIAARWDEGGQGGRALSITVTELEGMRGGVIGGGGGVGMGMRAARREGGCTVLLGWAGWAGLGGGMEVMVQVWMDVRDCKTERTELMCTRLSDRAQLLPRRGDYPSSPARRGFVLLPSNLGLFATNPPSLHAATPPNRQKPRRPRPSPSIL